MTKDNSLKLPELLAPAGSPLSLKAAIEAGADAVYMGGISFNARINAKNFTLDELRDGIALAHSYSTKVYIAANTLIFDKERDEFLRAAEQAYLLGADALIVADVGMAQEISKRIPIELHASTQISGHNVDAAKLLAAAGFSRMVCAREMSGDDIAYFCKNSPIESEVFVHGALCVSTSGQCLFSSIVGGRSGNRGECAQPCRLPFSTNGKQHYPLSLRDLSLAQHVSELCNMGVSSFKIEGRMKSPEYVRDVLKIWRVLLDERRNATQSEMRELENIFSRSGFTDGYFTKKTGRSMLGVRSEENKEKSSALIPFEKITRKLPISFSATFKKDEPITLCAASGEKCCTVQGELPQEAINAPLTKESVTKNLSKLGATPYELTELTLELDDGIIVPVSSINALRRAAIEELCAPNERTQSDIKRTKLSAPERSSRAIRSATFYNKNEIPQSAYEYFDEIFIPLEQYSQGLDSKIGVMLPEVIFDSQRDRVEAMLKNAHEQGAKVALVGNLGHIELAQRNGFALVGDFRINITNSSSAQRAQTLGFSDSILSPELSLAQMRDIGAGRAVVYGRIPLMLTEKCVGLELGGCEKCENDAICLTDRRGVRFPVMRRFEHRSAIFNSVPVYMADKQNDLSRSGIFGEHFIFSSESKRQAHEIIQAYRTRTAPMTNAIRRIKG